MYVCDITYKCIQRKIQINFRIFVIFFIDSTFPLCFNYSYKYLDKVYCNSLLFVIKKKKKRSKNNETKFYFFFTSKKPNLFSFFFFSVFVSFLFPLLSEFGGGGSIMCRETPAVCWPG